MNNLVMRGMEQKHVLNDGFLYLFQIVVLGGYTVSSAAWYNSRLCPAQHASSSISSFSSSALLVFNKRRCTCMLPTASTHLPYLSREIKVRLFLVRIFYGTAFNSPHCFVSASPSSSRACASKCTVYYATDPAASSHNNKFLFQLCTNSLRYTARKMILNIFVRKAPP
jgi:hypothetical protein